MFCDKCGAQLSDGSGFCVNCGNSASNFATGVPAKSKVAAALLCLFLGGLGAHRFYVGKVGSGLGMLFTGGGCGLWALIDFIMILSGSFTDSNGVPLK